MGKSFRSLKVPGLPISSEEVVNNCCGPFGATWVDA